MLCTSRTSNFCCYFFTSYYSSISILAAFRQCADSHTVFERFFDATLFVFHLFFGSCLALRTQQLCLFSCLVSWLLTGAIPVELLRLKSIRMLNLERNKLNGEYWRMTMGKGVCPNLAELLTKGWCYLALVATVKTKMVACSSDGSSIRWAGAYGFPQIWLSV